jgi:hypothetical protein
VEKYHRLASGKVPTVLGLEILVSNLLGLAEKTVDRQSSVKDCIGYLQL